MLLYKTPLIKHPQDFDELTKGGGEGGLKETDSSTGELMTTLLVLCEAVIVK